MEFSIKTIWESMGPLSKLVAASLLIMGIASLGIALERLVYLLLSGRQSRSFAPLASKLLTDGRIDEIAGVALCFPRSQLAELLRVGAKRYLAFCEQPDSDGLPPVEAARREMTRRAEQISSDLRAGLSVLASVGSIAPFVGLFGTVIGIITAFQGIARTGSGGLGAVSAGIAEALYETALGLLVAIPTVLLFNLLSSRIDEVERRISAASSEFIDGLEHLHGNGDRR